MSDSSSHKYVDPAEPPGAAGQTRDSAAADRLLTVAEVALFLRVADIFVYRHAAELGAFKLGSHLRFGRDSIDTWLASRRLSAASAECHLPVDNELMSRLLDKSKKRKVS